MRLLLDEMYPRRLAEALRTDGHDVAAVLEVAALASGSDADAGAWAQEAGRVVVTENVVDFAPLDLHRHAGVLLVNARRWPRTKAGIEHLRVALARWLDAHGDEAPPVSWLQP